MNCPICKEELVNGVCVNVNCTAAQQAATAAAGRVTAKATARAASSASEPRAFTSSGRVD